MIKNKIIIGLLSLTMLFSYQVQAMQSITSLLRLMANHRRLTMTVFGLGSLALYAYRRGYYPFSRAKAVHPAASAQSATVSVVPAMHHESVSQAVAAAAAGPHEAAPVAQDDLFRARIAASSAVNPVQQPVDPLTASSFDLSVSRTELTQSQLLAQQAPLPVQVKQAVGNGLETAAAATTTAYQQTQPYLQAGWQTAKVYGVRGLQQGAALTAQAGHGAWQAGLAAVGYARTLRQPNVASSGLDTSFIDVETGKHVAQN